MFHTISLIITTIVIVISYFIYVHIKNRRFWKMVEKFRGDKPLPVLGNALDIPNTSVGVFKYMFDTWQKYDRKTFKFQIVNAVFVILCEPEHIEFILNSSTELKKTIDYKFIKSWLGDGLLLADGNRWRSHRKIITPAFHFKILEQFVGIFEEKGQIFIKKLSEKKGIVFDVYPLMTLCALDIICESAMGTNVNAQEKSESEYIKAVYRMTELFHYRLFSVWKRFDFLYRFSSDYQDEKKVLKVLHGMTDRIIKSRKHQLQNKILNEKQIESKKKIAFLDLLLSSKTADGEPLTDLAIREEVNTFMFEGHDTTTACISYALYSLANNPDVQNLAFEEQLNLLGKDLSKHPTYSDLQEMKYLERVIKETLRIYPSVPIFGRTLINDVTLPDGRIIPKDAFALINVIAMGWNQKYFPDPMKFDPDRFLFENTKNNHPFLSIPFSAGPRNCIGQKFALLEMKSLLSKVLRNYELLSGGPGTELELAAEIVLKSKTGMKIQIRDRIYQ